VSKIAGKWCAAVKALITGASGFIGAHLAATLVARGNRVTCLVRPTSCTDRLDSLAVKLAYGDVGDPASLVAAMRGEDVVFHLAGLTKALAYEELLRVNELGTRNVAKACADQASPPVLVLVSSLAAAGPSPTDRPRLETDPACPVSNYGRSKRAGELAAVRFADRVPVTIVRPPVVFGEGDASMLPMFRPIKWLRVHLVPGFTERLVSMIHAVDLVAGLIAAAERGERVAVAGDGNPAQGYYFMAAERSPTFAEWGQLIARSLGCRRLRVVRAPELLSWGLAGANEAWARLRRRPHIFNLDKIREATAGSWVCGADRARRDLGFAVGADLESRFAQTTRWYRSQGWI
jgi:nucleoside-diphosphate-sugar epimerase